MCHMTAKRPEAIQSRCETPTHKHTLVLLFLTAKLNGRMQHEFITVRTVSAECSTDSSKKTSQVHFADEACVGHAQTQTQHLRRTE